MLKNSNVARNTPVKRNKPETFDIDRVTSHFFEPRRQTTYFRVRYTGYTGLFNQPAKDLVKCPFLVEKMEDKKGQPVEKVRI
jgi:hypothetical protein